MNRKQILTAGDYSKKIYCCQYLVIGTGAGGSIAGALLAEKGFKVIFLEEGKYFSIDQLTGKVGELTAKLYRNQAVFPFLGIPIIALGEGRCVGGGTVINGAGIFRTPRWILKDWEENYGLIGYNYSRLEKHFKTIEKDLNVIKPPLEEGTNKDSFKLFEGANKLGWRTEIVPRAAKNCQYRNACSVGCPEGAKQSTVLTYLPRALKKGAVIFSECKAIKIKHRNQKAYSVTALINNKKEKIHLKFDHLVVAGGAIQTPHLLKRSKIKTSAGENLPFHMNVKVTAKMEEPCYSKKSTIFPLQVHEFEKEDIYINTSIVKPTYIAMSLSPYGNKIINHSLNSLKQMVIFNTTIRAKSKGHIFSKFKDPLVWYRFDPRDLTKIKVSLKRMSELLFAGNASEIYLPIKNSSPVTSLRDANKIINKLKPGKAEIVSVHIMGSCPMGIDPKDSVVDLDGNLRGMKNILVADSSVLPTNIGQSPQGTIMALIHEIMRRHLEKK